MALDIFLLWDVEQEQLASTIEDEATQEQLQQRAIPIPAICLENPETTLIIHVTVNWIFL